MSWTVDEIIAWTQSDDPRAKKLSNAIFSKQLEIEALERDNQKKEAAIAQMMRDKNNLYSRLIASEEEQLQLLKQILSLQKQVDALEERGKT